ncbi:MAG: hypothetical protein Q8R46_05370 [Nitrosomonas sp.]|nr:hypothetical protein [Nitrosomonas sp.]
MPLLVVELWKRLSNSVFNTGISNASVSGRVAPDVDIFFQPVAFSIGLLSI